MELITNSMAESPDVTILISVPQKESGTMQAAESYWMFKARLARLH
jgi:hypothetical protein